MSAAAVALAASRIFAFAGHDMDTALVVLRQGGALNVGLSSLLALLPSLVGVALLYGTVYLVRRPGVRTSPAAQLAAGLVLGYGLFAMPWPVLGFYAVVAVVAAWPAHADADSSMTSGGVAAWIRQWAALPAVGLAAAAILVGGGGPLLPAEQLETDDSRVVVGFVLHEEDDDALVLREDDWTAVRLTLRQRVVCRLSAPTLLVAPPIMALRDRRPDYPTCEN